MHQKYICFSCNFSAEYSKYKKHIKSLKHSYGQKFDCVGCDQSFFSIKQLNDHLYSIHGFFNNNQQKYDEIDDDIPGPWKKNDCLKKRMAKEGKLSLSDILKNPVNPKIMELLGYCQKRTKLKKSKLDQEVLE